MQPGGPDSTDSSCRRRDPRAGARGVGGDINCGPGKAADLACGTAGATARSEVAQDPGLAQRPVAVAAGTFRKTRDVLKKPLRVAVEELRELPVGYTEPPDCAFLASEVEGGAVERPLDPAATVREIA